VVCSVVFQIIATAVVLAGSLGLGTLSLMGLGQGGREQRNYQVLDRASGAGIAEDQRPPGGLEDHEQQQRQQQHTEHLLDDSISLGETADALQCFINVCLFVCLFVCLCSYYFLLFRG